METEFSRGLREIATWFDQNPTFAPKYPVRISLGHLDGRASLQAVARALAPITKSVISPEAPTFSVERAFGPLTIAFLFWREAVCTSRVVGTEEVPAQPARPAYTRDILKWECGPIFTEERGEG